MVGDTYTQELCRKTLSQFDKVLWSHFTFHLGFFVLAMTEILALLIYFTLLIKSAFVAITLAVLFLTAFAFFILRLFYQARMPETLLGLCQSYSDSVKISVAYLEGERNHHLAVSSALCALEAQLKDREYTYFDFVSTESSIHPFLANLSCFCFWRSVGQMREILLEASIDEHVRLVKSDPSNLEYHAALASQHLQMASLLSRPETGPGQSRWVPAARLGQEVQEAYIRSMKKAIEEFQILAAYTPDDPWVYSQLAACYREIEDKDNELQIYQRILRIRPQDYDTLFKLGACHFQLGQNGEGLKVYDSLKRAQYKKAEKLMEFYGIAR